MDVTEFVLYHLAFGLVVMAIFVAILRPIRFRRDRTVRERFEIDRAEAERVMNPDRRRRAIRSPWYRW